MAKQEPTTLNEEEQRKLREKIAKKKENLKYLLPRYNELVDEATKLHSEIMTIYKELWSAERKLAPVFKPAPFKCPQTKLKPKRLAMPKLSDAEAAEFLKLLKEKGA